MEPNRYRRICALFDAALSRPSVERDAFLEDECAADGDLRREVERMIDHDRASTGLLDRAPMTATTTTNPTGTEELEALRPGARLGSYRIHDELGRGGMGVVYLATRDDAAFERQVAIKLVANVSAAKADAWRFRRERDILARLEHPYIARLYDGGTTEAQRPYLVMEYVDGLPITTYCDQHRLSITARLTLMRKVCAAVEFAHRSLVVHRDLKPSNILVNADGDPKLLDFGIAKLLDAGVAAEPAAPERERTLEHRRVMTLSHASPEQVVGHTITTATDVYGLGLILYELLCGVAPFALDSKSTYELLRRICEEPPAPPSVLVARMPSDGNHAIARSAGMDSADDGPVLVDVARHRGVPPRQLPTVLAGDLDAIVSMALRKEPQKRYASVAELGDDLDRHLGDRPVVARATAMPYRLGKFVRRHRAAVIVGGTLATLLVGLVTTFVFTLLAQVERTTREKVRAEKLLGFVIETFAVANPDAGVGETVTARELLDEGAKRVAFELQDDPELRASMLDAMGQIHYQIGLFATAESMLRESLAQRGGPLGDDSAASAASLAHLGAVQRDAGDMEGAEATLRRAIGIAEREGAHEALADALDELAFVHQFHYDYAEAEPIYRRAVATRRTLGAARKTADTLTAFGILLREQSDFEEAENVLRESLELRREHLGTAHPDYAESLKDMADLAHARAEYAEAESLKRQALDIAVAVHGENHRTVVDLKNTLALTLKQRGQDAEAAELLAECVESLRALTGGDNPDYATMVSTFASQLASLGQFDRAEALFREVLSIRQRLFPAGHPYIGHTHQLWAQLEFERGDLAAAAAHYQKAIEGAANLPPGHRAIAYPHMELASVFIDQGQPSKAIPMLEEALVELRSSHDPGHWRIAMATAHLGRAQAAMGEIAVGEAHLSRALASLRENHADNPERKRHVLEWLIDVERSLGRPDAVAEHQEMLAGLRVDPR